LEKPNLKFLIKYNLLFALLLFFANQYIVCQEYIFEQFDTKNGLPSSEVYHVFQDSKGYIWFATDNGVSRYNGYDFTNYDINDGLAESAISEVYEDSKKRIWFIGVSGKLAYYYKQKISPYKYNDFLEDELPENSTYLKSNFYVDSVDNVYISIKGLDLYKIDNQGQITAYRKKAMSRNVLSIYQINDKAYLSTVKKQHADGRSTSPYDLLLNKRKESETMVKLPDVKKGYPHHVFAKYVNDSTFWFGADKKIFFIVNDSIKKAYDFKTRVIWMDARSSNELCVCTVQDGAFCFLMKNGQIKLNHHQLKGYTVTSTLLDKFGVYWFTTLNNGVFKLNSEKHRIISKKSGLLKDKIKCIEVANNTLFTGYNVPQFSITTQGNTQHVEIPGNEQSFAKTILFDEKNKQIAIAANDFLYLIKSNNVKTIKNKMPSTPSTSDGVFNSTCLISDNDGGYWIGGGDGFYHVKYNHVVFDSRINKNFKIRVNSLLLDKKNNLWLGCKDGLRILKNGKIQYLGNEFTELKSRILDIAIHNRLLILATKGKGILFYDGNSVKNITKKEGLSSNMITSLAIHNNTLWAGSLNGLNKISLLQSQTGKFTIEESSELSSFEIYQIKTNDNELYLATNQGVVIYNIDWKKKAALHIPFYFTGFIVNGEDQEIKKEYYLQNRQNNISISFEVLNYTSNVATEYKYRLNGLDTSWIYSTKREVDYYNLRPGNYQFEVEIKSAKGSWINETETINIEIAPAFWQTIPFYAGLGLTVLTLIWLTYAIWNANARKKMQLERKLYDYKLKTLWGQMKPHFIFNTLNSINSYIISNQTISASKYLTRFSALIRKILVYTQYDSISLDEELDTLELYMKIETIRLKNKFTYKILVDENVDRSNTQLPGMILQPFVENSIWHGILPLNKKGIIKIKVYKKENKLVIEIIDNGIGREDAILRSKKTTSQKRPHGTNIAKERLNIFARKLDKKARVEYIDLVTNIGIIGTKVRITMPLILRKTDTLKLEKVN
jgi:ligand-binding sensor domain-containing protein/anti-sigma regulatory factor (Ser/Thr protein kinase)